MNGFEATGFDMVPRDYVVSVLRRVGDPEFSRALVLMSRIDNRARIEVPLSDEQRVWLLAQLADDPEPPHQATAGTRMRPPPRYQVDGQALPKRTPGDTLALHRPDGGFAGG